MEIFTEAATSAQVALSAKRATGALALMEVRLLWVISVNASTQEAALGKVTFCHNYWVRVTEHHNLSIASL